MSRLVSTFAELNKRRLFQIAVIYIGAAWVFIEITDFVVGNYGFSRKVLDTVVLLVLLGFPAVLVIAWYHGEKGHQRIQRAEMSLLLTLGALAAIGTYRITTAEEVPETPGVVGLAEQGEAAPRGGAGALLADGGESPDLGTRSIAVLPFRNHVASDELEWLGAGLADLLTTNFAQLPRLRVVGRQRLFDLLLEEGREEEDEIPESLAATVARAAGARLMVWGTVAGTPEDLAIDAQLIDVETGTVTAAERVRGSDVFALVDSLSSRLAGRLGDWEGRPPPKPLLADMGTKDLDALAAFQEGIRLERMGQPEAAHAAFDRAMTLDSTFMLPMVRLSGHEAEFHGPEAPAHPAMPDDAVAERVLVEAERHRDRALRMIEAMGEDLVLRFGGLEGPELLAAIDSTVGEALSSVRVIVRESKKDSLGRAVPPPRPRRENPGAEPGGP